MLFSFCNKYVSSPGESRLESKDSSQNQGTTTRKNGHSKPSDSSLKSRWDVNGGKTLKKTETVTVSKPAAAINITGHVKNAGVLSSSSISSPSGKSNAPVQVEYIYKKGAGNRVGTDQSVYQAQSTNEPQNSHFTPSGSDMDLSSIDSDGCDDEINDKATCNGAIVQLPTDKHVNQAQSSNDPRLANSGSDMELSPYEEESSIDGKADTALATVEELFDGDRSIGQSVTLNRSSEICPLTGNQRHGRVFPNLHTLGHIHCAKSKLFDKAVTDVFKSLESRIFKLKMKK
eukprot:gene791-10521_t